MQPQVASLTIRERQVLERLAFAKEKGDPWQSFGPGWEKTARNLCDADFVQESDGADGVVFRITGRGEMALAQQTPPPAPLSDNENHDQAAKTLSKPEGSEARINVEAFMRATHDHAPDHVCIYRQALELIGIEIPEAKDLLATLDAIHRRAGK